MRKFLPNKYKCSVLRSWVKVSKVCGILQDPKPMQNKHFRWEQLWVKSPMETCTGFLSKRKAFLNNWSCPARLVYFWEFAQHHLHQEYSLLVSSGCVQPCMLTCTCAYLFQDCGSRTLNSSASQGCLSPSNAESGRALLLTKRRSWNEENRHAKHSRIKGSGRWFWHYHLHCQMRRQAGKSWDLFKIVELVTEPRPEPRTLIPRIRFSQ